MACFTPFLPKISGKFTVKITFCVQKLSFSGDGWVHKFGSIVQNLHIFFSLSSIQSSIINNINNQGRLPCLWAHSPRSPVPQGEFQNAYSQNLSFQSHCSIRCLQTTYCDLSQKSGVKICNDIWSYCSRLLFFIYIFDFSSLSNDKNSKTR